MDKNVDKAREKLERESIAAGSAKDRIREFCLLWLEVSDKAAELILTKEKSVSGAYNFMRDKAAKNRGGMNCICVSPEEAAEVILEYFGMKKDEAQQELEHGLMYQLMIAASKRYKPYGVAEAENPHPVTEVETVKEDVPIEQPHRAAVNLSAFSMGEFL